MPFSGRASPIKTHVWLQKATGRRASVYGALPYRSSAQEEGWELVETGWDIAWDGDSTVGRCQAPFKTEAEAVAYADDWNQKRAAHYDALDRASYIRARAAP